MAGKVFTERAKANAAAIQAATDYLTSQLQAKASLNAAHAKIRGDLQQSMFDVQEQRAQERAQAADEAAAGQSQAQEPYPTVPLPNAAQPSQSLQGAGISFDPSQVSGGGGIQQASGINGGGAPPATPQSNGGYAGTGYQVPPTITSVQQSSGTRPMPIGELGAMQVPFNEVSQRTTQNALTPAQALSIYQAGELGKQRLALQAWLDRTTALKNIAMAHKATAGIGEISGLEAARIRTGENALRSNFEQESKPFKSAVEAFNEFQTALQEPHTGFRDMKLIYQFIKSQDNTAVREGEIALAQSAVGKFPQWANLFERIQKGETLLPEKSIADLAGLMYGGIKGHIGLQKLRESQYGRITAGQGLRPDQVIYPLITPELENAVNTPVRPNMNPEGVPATAIPILKHADGSIIYEDPSPFPNMPGQKYEWTPSAADQRMINGPTRGKAGIQ